MYIIGLLCRRLDVMSVRPLARRTTSGDTPCIRPIPARCFCLTLGIEAPGRCVGATRLSWATVGCGSQWSSKHHTSRGAGRGREQVSRVSNTPREPSRSTLTCWSFTRPAGEPSGASGRAGVNGSSGCVLRPLQHSFSPLRWRGRRREVRRHNRLESTERNSGSCHVDNPCLPSHLPRF